MDTSPKFSFPSRADLERGCMPDGSPIRFPSRELDGERWPGPLPGKSTVTKTALKQDPPEGCGSIYTPPKGSIPYTGVPCPVPEQGDASMDKAYDEAELLQEQIAYGRIAKHNQLVDILNEVGIKVGLTLKEHPEIMRPDVEDAPCEEPKEPEREKCEQPKPDLAQTCDKVKALHDDLQGMLQQSCADPEDGEAGPKAAPPNLDASSDSGSRTAASRPRIRIPRALRGGVAATCNAILRAIAPFVVRTNQSALEQLELGKKILARGKQSDLKHRFVNDRAHAAVSGWLLHLDMAFQDLGFGGWMPFRYADQWLTFVSLTRKLLAANGMITPKGPNHWRKFIEETPEVETEDDPLKLPKSLAPTKKYAAIESISEIIQRATKKTEHDVDFRKTFNSRFAMGP